MEHWDLIPVTAKQTNKPMYPVSFNQHDVSVAHLFVAYTRASVLLAK
jgi:hypothetical protein